MVVRWCLLIKCINIVFFFFFHMRRIHSISKHTLTSMIYKMSFKKNNIFICYMWRAQNIIIHFHCHILNMKQINIRNQEQHKNQHNVFEEAYIYTKHSIPNIYAQSEKNMMRLDLKRQEWKRKTQVNDNEMMGRQKKI